MSDSVLKAFQVVATIRPARGGIFIRTELQPLGAHSVHRPLFCERRYPIVMKLNEAGAVDLGALFNLREAVAREVGSWIV